MIASGISRQPQTLNLQKCTRSNRLLLSNIVVTLNIQTCLSHSILGTLGNGDLGNYYINVRTAKNQEAAALTGMISLFSLSCHPCVSTLGSKHVQDVAKSP